MVGLLLPFHRLFSICLSVFNTLSFFHAYGYFLCIKNSGFAVLFSSLKMFFCLLASKASSEKSMEIHIIVSHVMRCFLAMLLRNFSWSLFLYFHCDMPGCDHFVFILFSSYPGLTELFKSVNVYILSNFGETWPLFFQILFLLFASCALSFWDSKYTYSRPLMSSGTCSTIVLSLPC